MAEAATLAHVVRPLVLAQSLAGSAYEVHFACAENDLMQGKDFLFRGTDFTRWPIHSQSSARFLGAIASGARLFDFPTLKDYAEDDLRLFERVRPDLVVGDLRHSLLASAPAYGVTHVALQNAYWSPYTTLEEFPLPEFPSMRRLVRWVGTRQARRLFDLASPWVFRQHLSPYNRLRRHYDLPPFDSLPHALTHGDHTLYADLPELVPTPGRPPNHRYLGPVPWSPPVPLPPWWEALPEGNPKVYVSLGSSGQAEALPAILKALAGLPVTAMLATAGTRPRAACPDNVHSAEYLPGDLAAERSALVIGNGGSGMIYQALAAGVPILGIPSNMDQLLAMAHVERAGCGIQLRSGAADAGAVSRAVEALLGEDQYRMSAQGMRQAVRRHDACRTFSAFLDEVFAGTS